MNENLLEDNPELMALSSDVRFVRFAIILLDPGSPLHAAFKDLDKKKNAAADFSGFDAEETEQVVSFDSLTELGAASLKACHGYLVGFIKERMWAMIMANEFAFWENIGRMMEPIKIDADGDKNNIQAHTIKTKLSEDNETLNTRIEKQYLSFYYDDDKLNKEAKKRRMSRPENFAQ